MLNPLHLLRVFIRSFPSFAITGLLLLVPATAGAEEDISGEAIQVVVTATRTETDVADVGSSMSVITEEQIEKSGKKYVLELLRGMPGVAVVQVGGRGKTATVFLRGGESDHTMVLIDGVRVNSSNTGSFDFADLRTENVEQIEILRGPQSVLYGSEAIGGVINIITKRAKEGMQLSATLSAGSHSTQNYSLGASYGDDDIQSSTTVSFTDSEGFSIAQEDNGNTEEDGYQNVTVSTRNSVPIAEDGTVDTTLLYAHSETDLDDFSFGVGPVDALHSESERDLVTGSIIISKPVSEMVTPSLEVALSDEDTRGTDPDTEFNNFSIDNQSVATTGKVEIIPSDMLSIVSGYTYEERHGENVGIFNAQREVHSVFANAQILLAGKADINVGVRYDDDSQFGGETTYRATASVPLVPGLRLHGSAGTGFKAPSFNELYFPNFGVESLDAETSTGYDLGVEHRFCNDTAVADVTFFYNEFDDLIGFNTTTFLAANIAEARSSGVEASLAFEVTEDVSIASFYTYTDTEDRSTGELLARRPQHSGSIDVVAQPLAALDVSLRYYLVRDRIDSGGAEMDNYGRVDLAASYRATDSVKPFLRIENLLNKDYEEVPGYGTPGFVAFAGVTITG